MRAAVYIRVSTYTQKSDSQRAEIRAWLIGNGHDPESCLWFEDVESGAKTDHPALARLTRAVFDGKIDVIVIWKLDRLARSIRDGVNLLCDWVDRGVRVVSTTQAINLSGPSGRIVASVLLGVAEIELSNIRERQAAGIAAAKARGVYKGRKRGTTKADPARARWLKAQGLSSREIMAALGIKSRSTLWGYLRS